jgi:hypothetical protein
MEPLSLTVLTASALTEGIKFLYTQAGELLRRRRERKDGAAVSAEASPPSPEARAVLVGHLEPLRIDFAAAERLESEIRALRAGLGDVAEEIEPADVGNQDLLDATDALRRAMEVVYHQRLTFQGEQRPPSGPIIEADLDIERVAGYVAGIRAKVVTGGHLRAKVETGTVEAGGSVVGVDIDRIS